MLSHVQLFCNPMDCSPPGSSVHGISQARILQWVAFPSPGDLPNPGIKPTSAALQADSLPAEQGGSLILPYSRYSSRNVLWKAFEPVKLLSCVQLFAIPWTIAYQTPPSMEFSRQEYWSGLHFLLQGIFLTQGLNPGLLHCRQTLYHLSYQGSPKWKAFTCSQTYSCDKYVYV